MKKTFKFYIGIWAILLVLFNVVAFVSRGWYGLEKYTASFWIGYVFITLAFLGQLYCAKLAFAAESLQKMFYNIPLITVSATGLFSCFAFGALCMIISPLPYWIGILGCVLTLAFTAIAVIKARIAGETLAEVDEKVKGKTLFIKSLTMDAESLLAKASSEEMKAECKKVYEAVRYSDPMSHEALVPVESQMAIRFADLKDAVADNDMAEVKKAARELTILAEDRNKRCKLLK